MANPQTYEEWCEDLRQRPDKDVIVFRDLRSGGIKQQAGMTVWQEREDAKQKKIRDEEFKRLADIKQKREDEHTLLAYWKLADLPERFGVGGIFFTVFLFGYLCAKMNFLSRLVDLIRDVIP